jgi:hypothetical protein
MEGKRLTPSYAAAVRTASGEIIVKIGRYFLVIVRPWA